MRCGRLIGHSREEGRGEEPKQKKSKKRLTKGSKECRINESAKEPEEDIEN